jgi:uncharacterized damage-inducible protein DinB
MNIGLLEDSVKDLLLMYAGYTKKSNAAVLELMDGLGAEAREADRKNFYRSLSGLAIHILDATYYFQGLIRASFPAAEAPLAATSGLAAPEGTLSAAAWEKLKSDLERADQASIDLVASLGEGQLSHPIELDWYDGEPPTVPFFFMANQLFVHGIHHRGHISQILDELGIEHDFSGIELEFLPKRVG